MSQRHEGYGTHRHIDTAQEVYGNVVGNPPPTFERLAPELDPLAHEPIRTTISAVFSAPRAVSFHESRVGFFRQRKAVQRNILA